MRHSVLAVDSKVLVVDQHFAQEVDGFVAAQHLVVVVDEVRPRFLLELFASHQLLDVLGYFEVIFVNVFVKLFVSKHHHDSYKLVKVVFSLEESFDSENHACECATNTPNV